MSKEGFLRTDLHAHNLFSPDSCATSEAVVKRCLAKGITCLAVTNHNTISGAQETMETAQEMGVNLAVITGEEITTGETNSVGKKIEILAYFLEEAIPSNLSIRETLKEIQKQRALAGIPHPFELWRHGAGEEIAVELIKKAGEIGVPVLWEIFNSRSSVASNRKAADFLQRHPELVDHNFFIVVGSDTHHVGEIGRSQIHLRRWETKEGFLQSLRVAKGIFEGHNEPYITFIYRILNCILLLRQKLKS